MLSLYFSEGYRPPAGLRPRTNRPPVCSRRRGFWSNGLYKSSASQDRAVLVLAPTGQTELSLALCASARSRARPSASQEGAPRPPRFGFAYGEPLAGFCKRRGLPRQVPEHAKLYWARAGVLNRRLGKHNKVFPSDATQEVGWPSAKARLEPKTS